ncbi:type II toxin-antitoxin system ParD family antitoxin [Corynebacterium sp. TA-R-1]|uniref:Type II toxin-antitoxin system ParD family antitoxin n=1 Tax=Corynebacterium stercoris TaxID=2943490 RepID=A0ABT1G310_9CORY|nr:type II toxin-antitoxin system ParD family antitoxin [Corynebacterium stercoris]MCP1388389.1 type II toxin-antitoxin system ParD family antitoxin [Corynebacterium stercoris]
MAGKNTSVVLGERYDHFISHLLESGRYASASEVLREGLRLVEEREQRFEALRAAIEEGLDSGPALPIDFDAYLRDI